MLLFLTLGCKPRPVTSPVIYLVGDSTIAEKRADKRPETGWGEKLKQYFNDNVIVKNHAVNGRSSKSFRDEGRWRTVIDAVHPGDFVLIGFGHNDGKPDSARFSSPPVFQKNMEDYVRELRVKKANAILLTPIVRRKFDAGGELQLTHGKYPDAARAAAASTKTPLIDLTAASRLMIGNYGPEKSKELFLWLEPGEHSNYPKGKKDDTHLSPAGASLVAGMVAREIERQGLPLKEYLKLPIVFD
ncbi:MAG: rhamnogalacturonan acetylesterase [Lewinella sp.]